MDEGRRTAKDNFLAAGSVAVRLDSAKTVQFPLSRDTTFIAPLSGVEGDGDECDDEQVEGDQDETEDEQDFSRVLVSPVKPSPDQVDQHNISHLPFRN